MHGQRPVLPAVCAPAPPASRALSRAGSAAGFAPAALPALRRAGARAASSASRTYMAVSPGRCALVCSVRAGACRGRRRLTSGPRRRRLTAISAARCSARPLQRPSGLLLVCPSRPCSPHGTRLHLLPLRRAPSPAHPACVLPVGRADLLGTGRLRRERGPGDYDHDDDGRRDGLRVLARGEQSWRAAAPAAAGRRLTLACAYRYRCAIIHVGTRWRPTLWQTLRSWPSKGTSTDRSARHQSCLPFLSPALPHVTGTLDHWAGVCASFEGRLAHPRSTARARTHTHKAFLSFAFALALVLALALVRLVDLSLVQEPNAWSDERVKSLGMVCCRLSTVSSKALSSRAATPTPRLAMAPTAL